MKAFVTGDTHGSFSHIEEFCERNHTTKDDVLVVLGDSGINYFEDFRDEELKKRLAKLPITLLCIHGNHEQRPYAIPTYQEEMWNGGIVYKEMDYPNLLFAKDGEIYDLFEIKMIVIGGAYSVDKYVRIIRGWKWFKNEQPSNEIKTYVEKKLSEVNWEVDIVLSHTCPLRYEPVEAFLHGIDQSHVDKTTEVWLDKIEEKLAYKKWYCGHFHTEKEVDKIEFLFTSIKELSCEQLWLYLFVEV